MISSERDHEGNAIDQRVAELRRVRDELREDLEALSDSVRWLRSEQRALERAPKSKVAVLICVACGLGALLGVGLAVGAS